MIFPKKQLSFLVISSMGWFVAVGLTSSSFAIDEHETPGKSLPPEGKRKTGQGKEEGVAGCNVPAKDLSAFANGDRYNFKSLVSYLSDDACQVNGGQIAQAALAEKIDFNRSPFHLDVVGNSFSKLTLDGARRVDLTLSQTMPALLRENTLSSRELYPVVGQLAILSPNAARGALSYLIQQELMAGSDMLEKARAGKEIVATDVAKQLLRLGASEQRIVAQLAEDVEDRAVAAEADSLARIFRALTQAAEVEGSLVPTLNASSSALNRGIGRSVSSYEPDQKRNMVKSVFEMIDVVAMNSQKFEPTAEELNSAMVSLLAKTKLEGAFWKKIWRDALRVLAHSTTQTALAEALARSFTANLIYLPKNDLEVILEAGKNYRIVANAIQWNLLQAIRVSSDELHEGRIEVPVYNARRKQFYEPLVTKILDFEPSMVDDDWLRDVLRRGLVSDDDIEKKFPRLVLSILDRQARAAKNMSREDGLDPVMQSMMENQKMLWTLSTVHVPALSGWLEKYDAE